METKESVTPNPCPWCGGQASVKRIDFLGPDYFVSCANLQRCFSSGPTAESEAEAIAAWNRVAKPKEQTEQSGSEGR